MLSFIGKGSSFNAKLGNNSAYIKEGKSLLLIDCGGTVFHALKNKDILKDIENIHVLITHTHPDHVGSLGDLIFYSYYILNKKLTIYFPEGKHIQTILELLGVGKEFYNLNTSMKKFVEDDDLGSFRFEFTHNSHVETMTCFSILLSYKSESIYYSGDSNVLPQDIIEKLRVNLISKIYQDTSGLEYEGNAHLSFNKLCALVPEELRDRVYCMHLDGHISQEGIKSKGFMIPE